MDIIKTFVLNNTTHTINILQEDGESLFRADQVGRVLGIKNIHTSIKNLLDEDEKVLRRSTGSNSPIIKVTTIIKTHTPYLYVLFACIVSSYINCIAFMILLSSTGKEKDFSSGLNRRNVHPNCSSMNDCRSRSKDTR
jgi:hypothetical protein